MLARGSVPRFLPSILKDFSHLSLWGSTPTCSLSSQIPHWGLHTHAWIMVSLLDKGSSSLLGCISVVVAVLKLLSAGEIPGLVSRDRQPWAGPRSEPGQLA